MSNYRVGILGATGAVGQKFIRLLQGHPWFKITALGASSRSAGKSYKEAAAWVESFPLPPDIAQAEVRKCTPGEFQDVDFIFSGLDASVAESIESAFASSGIPVISNAKNFRMHDNVPLLVPEVNPDHIDLIPHQNFDEEGRGWIVTNPNCVVVPLVMSLKPLHDRFGINSVILTSMQAVSGAGYPGVPSLDILGNVIPFISGEESKIHTEPLKLLGEYRGDRVRFADFPIQATATRVPVRNGHLLSVSVSLVETPENEDAVKDIMKSWKSPLNGLGLPSAPEQPLFVYDEDHYPQPLLQADEGKGMRTAIGRIRASSGAMDISYVAMAHNTVRGAAGGAILNAELLASKKMIRNK
ncbi:MAG: aspartate-semialdehyde dehydrogenase [Balneolaceae bacterium]